MKTIKIKYVGWWTAFNADKYLINKILSKYYNVEISDNPDYVFCSLYSDEYKKYDCVRIFYTGENYTPDFNCFDYAIGFDNITFGDRYIRVPNWIMNPNYEDDVKLMITKHTREIPDKSDFCSFVVSNENGSEIRRNFFEELSKYKKVNSGGRYLNNIGLPNGVENKLEFQQRHRFSIAFENSSHRGYTTEKLIQGFAACTVPIYWGDAVVGKVFNKGAFVDANDFPSLEKVVEEVQRIDQNPQLYMKMLKTPALRSEGYVEDKKNELERFLINIFEQPLDEAKRRQIGGWGGQSGENTVKKQSNILDRLARLVRR